MKYIIVISVFLCSCFYLSAKDLSIESFEELTSDLSAKTSPVFDFNDNACALIKIAIPDKASLEGNVIQSHYKTNEYYVYVTPGTKKLALKYPGVETLDVQLSDYLNNEGVRQARTYRLKLGGIPEEIVELTPIQSQGQSLDYQNTGTLILNVEPKDAEILINGLPQKPNAIGQLVVNLPLGTHSYRINANKYYSKEGQINLTKKNNREERKVNLKPQFGYISINAGSEMDGAEVRIDGNYFGTLPLINKSIDNGSHTVTITKKLYQPFSQNINVSDSSIVNLRPTFASNHADVEIILEDREVELYDNGERLHPSYGKWKGKLETGNHRIEVRKDYHQTAVRNIQVATNQNQTIKFDRLVAMQGLLEVNTFPEDADIYLDGKKVAKGKYSTKKLKPGTYTLAVKAPGYDSQQKTLYLSNGKVVNENISLKKTVYSCKIDGSPGASATLDGRYIRLPYTITGNQGEKHKVELSWPNKGKQPSKKKKKTITLGKDTYYYGPLEYRTVNRGRVVANIIQTIILPGWGALSFIWNPIGYDQYGNNQTASGIGFYY